MLGNVYGDEPSAADAAPVDAPVLTRPVAKLPEWADEDVLDEAFAQWVPGPPADAPAVERSMLSELAATTVPARHAEPSAAAPVPTVADDDPFVDASPLDDLAGYEPMIDPMLADATARAAVEASITRGWQRSDDDILPGKAGKKGRRAA